MLRFNNHSGLPNVRTGFTNIRKKVIFMAGVFRRSWKRTRSITSRQKQKTTCSRNTLKLTTKFILLKRITSQASQVTYYARKKSCLFKFLWGWAAGFLRPKKNAPPTVVQILFPPKRCPHENVPFSIPNPALVRPSFCACHCNLYDDYYTLIVLRW